MLAEASEASPEVALPNITLLLMAAVRISRRCCMSHVRVAGYQVNNIPCAHGNYHPAEVVTRVAPSSAPDFSRRFLCYIYERSVDAR